MNILLIGNGFDLAHELPTKYTDFLNWIIDQTYFYEYLKEEGSEIVKKIHSLKVNIPEAKRKKNHSQRVPHQQEIWHCINDNVWIEYFLQNSMYQRENWIDFESEIFRLIKSLDDDMNTIGDQRLELEDKIQRITNKFLQERYSDWFEKKTYGELRDVLSNDLNRLIRVLEIYISEYIEKMKISIKSPNIEELKIDHVLSFNYSHTFSNLYEISENAGKAELAPFDYIHGEAKADNSLETNKMVLGIDEYLPNDRKNTDIEFIDFKKFYQRIYKETGSKYKDWLDIIKKDEHELKEKYGNEYPTQIPFKLCIGKQHFLYIFGHSLDITDQDVLRDLMLNDNVKTIIFYRNRDELRKKIANLNKVIHQDELIRRTGGSTKTIYFELQQEMKPIKGEETF